MALSLTSPAFSSKGGIPKEFTCEGQDQAPALAWTGTPAGTKAFALIVDDPDAPDPKAPKTEPDRRPVRSCQGLVRSRRMSHIGDADVA